MHVTGFLRFEHRALYGFRLVYDDRELLPPHSFEGREVASIIDGLGGERISGLKCRGPTKHVVWA